MAAQKKLNAGQVAAVERHYGSLAAGRIEFAKLKAEQAEHNGNAAKLLAAGGLVVYLAAGKFSLVPAASLCGWEYAFVF